MHVDCSAGGRTTSVEPPIVQQAVLVLVVQEGVPAPGYTMPGWQLTTLLNLEEVEILAH